MGRGKGPGELGLYRDSDPWAMEKIIKYHYFFQTLSKFTNHLNSN
jgi:hypothetical protein